MHSSSKFEAAMKRVRLLLFCLWLLPSQALAIDEAQMRARAAQILKKLEPSWSAEDLSIMRVSWPRPGQRSRVVRVQFPRFDVDFDEDTEEILFINYALRSQSISSGWVNVVYSPRGRAFFKSDNELMEAAKAKLKLTEFSYGPIFNLTNTLTVDPQGNVPRKSVGVRFYESHHGYSAYGWGNSVGIMFDSISGELVYVDRQVGWTYEDTQVKLNQDDALRIAAGVSDVPKGSKVYGPSYVSCINMHSKTRSRRWADATDKKILLLVFTVYGTKEYVYVAADTGEVLGKFSNATASAGPPRSSGLTSLGATAMSMKTSSSPPNSSNRHRSPSEESSSAVVTLIAGVAAAFGAGYAALRWSKSK